jgi:hypothetical protein
MKKLFAALAALACVSVAQAVIIPIDDFSANQGPISDGTASAAATAPPDAVCDTNAIRTLCSSLIASDGIDNNIARVAGGSLRISNEASSDTQVTLRWNIAAGLVPASAIGTFNFLVVLSDGNPTNLQFFFNNALLAADNISANTVNQTVSFGAPIAALNAGGVLELRVNGAAGWDLTADNFGLDITNLQVPVPAIPLLLGAGLVAIGLRRKQK